MKYIQVSYFNEKKSTDQINIRCSSFNVIAVSELILTAAQAQTADCLYKETLWQYNVPWCKKWKFTSWLSFPQLKKKTELQGTI